MIGVKNNTGEKLTARYDGQDFTFEAGGPAVAISEDAARHIFGFGLENKQQVLQRLGWMRSLDHYSEAVKKLAGFQFLAVEQTIKEPVKIPLSASTEVMLDPKEGDNKVRVEIPVLGKK